MVFYKVGNTVYCSVYGSGTKIKPLWLNSVCRCFYSNLYKLVNTFVFAGNNGNNRHAQKLLKFVYIYCAAVFPNLVHHIHGYNHRDIKLCKLKAKIKISLYICCIYNIYNTVWFLIYKKISCNNFLACIRRKRIYSRNIDNRTVFLSSYFSFFFVYRNSRKIAYVLI